jgi:hypothetical protein
MSLLVIPRGVEESLTLTSQISQQGLKISAVADRRYRSKIDIFFFELVRFNAVC